MTVKLFMCNNDKYKSLETTGIWVRFNNVMSVIGCKQDTGSRHSVPVSSLQLFKLSKDFKMSLKLQKSLSGTKPE